jgi:peptidoglycan L-alanyl-D-glutamate endopeptidase CwlK
MSRKLSDLTPEMQLKVGVLVQLADEAGLDLLIYCTFRTLTEQDDLYAIGRTQPGRIVTRAKAGQSAHNYGLAIDAVPMIAGKPQWRSSSPLWKVYGELAAKAGLEWAGKWTTFREYPHCQMPGFNWREMV